MSRSFKKPILKDKDKSRSKMLNRIIRRNLKKIINSSDDLENLEIPDPKIIVNDWDYCDWKCETCGHEADYMSLPFKHTKDFVRDILSEYCH